MSLIGRALSSEKILVVVGLYVLLLHMYWPNRTVSALGLLPQGFTEIPHAEPHGEDDYQTPHAANQVEAAVHAPPPRSAA